MEHFSHWQSSKLCCAKILLVEGEKDLAGSIVSHLAGAGLNACTVASGIEMEHMVKHREFDLIILDAVLPGEDGFRACKRVRASFAVPILMLTPNDAVDRILGLELGADDCLAKPFNFHELLARVKSQLRRTIYNIERLEPTNIMTFAGWKIDASKRQISSPEGLGVTITAAEFDIMLALCKNAGRVMTRKQLLSFSHVGTAGPVQRSIDVHVSRLRQKIEQDPKQPTIIKTVRLGGYILTAEVKS